jgi:peptidoglycan/LPS O-acetylase OafA/YrhL
MRHNPALDGLRAVAIIFVICAHSFPRLLPNGWLGVDVFFVLSGYLITSILTNELRQTGAVNYRNFYIRRVLRLAPAMLLLVAFQFIHAAFSPHNAHDIRTATWISLAQVENFNLAFGSWPRDVIGHTWSLATEEQFYWLWPFALPLVVGRRPLLWLGAASAAMIVARVVGWPLGAGYFHIQFGPDVRPIGLLIGCALALIPAASLLRIPTAGLRLAALICLVALVALASTGGDTLNWNMVLSPIAASLATAGIIMGLHQQGGVVFRLLAVSPAVYVGKISYGLYLFTGPIFFIGEGHNFGLPFYLYDLALVGLGFAAAALSYEFVEKPCLRLKSRVGQRVALPAAAPAE